MNSQSLILLAIGLFVGLIVTAAAIDQYLFNEHPPSEVSGLLWRAKTAFAHIKDLEAVLEVSESRGETEPIRMLVRLVNSPPQALSIRYLDPPSLQDELFTVDNDLLSHYIPEEDLIVVKRWVGIPLAAIGLSILDPGQLEREWKAGKVTVRILQSVPSFSTTLSSTPLCLSETLSGEPLTIPYSFCLDTASPAWMSFAELSGTSPIRAEYILEVRDAKTGELTRMIWIDRDTYFVKKVVFFSGDKRTKTITVQRIEVDQGLTAEEVLRLPTGALIIRG